MFPGCRKVAHWPPPSACASVTQRGWAQQLIRAGTKWDFLYLGMPLGAQLSASALPQPHQCQVVPDRASAHFLGFASPTFSLPLPGFASQCPECSLPCPDLHEIPAQAVLVDPGWAEGLTWVGVGALHGHLCSLWVSHLIHTSLFPLEFPGFSGLKAPGISLSSPFPPQQLLVLPKPLVKTSRLSMG